MVNALIRDYLVFLLVGVMGCWLYWFSLELNDKENANKSIFKFAGHKCFFEKSVSVLVVCVCHRRSIYY